MIQIDIMEQKLCNNINSILQSSHDFATSWFWYRLMVPRVATLELWQWVAARVWTRVAAMGVAATIRIGFVEMVVATILTKTSPMETSQPT